MSDHQRGLFDFEDSPESTDADPSPDPDPQGEGSEDTRPDGDYPELPPCPWCYSHNLIDGNRGVACGECSASIPVDADWYQRGEVVGIDF